MALIVEAVGKTGIVERIAVEGGGAVINAQPGLTYRILDGNGRQVNANATVRRVGDHLIIEGLPEEATVQLTDFFFVCTPNDPCALDLEGLGGARGETISQISEPIAAMADGSFVLHAPASMATPVAPESEFSAKPALAGLALLAVGGGGGGGGSGGDGPPPPPPGSTTVTSAPFTNDSTPVITGTAVPGSQITITLDIPGSGPVTFNTIADGNGDWSVDTGAATPSAGTMPAGGIPEDAPTTVRVLTAGSTAVVSYQLAIDRVLPDAPVIEAVTGDDVINADEGREANPSPITVQGTAEAGARVRVSWHGDDQIAVADAEGRWAVTFDGQKIPDGNYIISAVATDVAGNTGPAANRAVAVATGRPSAPDFDDVAGDNIVNAAETADGVTITGTTSAGTQVFVSIAGLFTDREATVTGTDWSVTVSPAELGQLPDGQPIQVTAFASDGVNRSVVSASDPVRVDRTPPGPATIDGPVEGNDIVNNAEAADGVVITGTAEAGVTVEVRWGNITLDPVDVNEDGEWTAVFGPGQIPANGTHTISAIAIDAAGNRSTVPGERSVTVDMTVAPPVIGNVASNNLVNGTEAADGVVVSGTAESGSSVAVTWDGVTRSATATGGSWSITFPSTDFGPAANQINDGSHTINAIATDPAGNVSTAGTRMVSVDTAAPAAPEINQPIAGDNAVNADEAADGVVVSGTAESGSTVAVTWDGVTRSATAAGGSWTVTFPSTDFGPAANQINDGSHTISAIATDPAGNVSTAGTRTVSVDTAAPAAPEIDQPIAGDNAVNADEAADGVVVSGTAESGSTVAVTWDGVTRSATATGGSWSITFPSTDFGPAANQINDGSHTISAIATNSTGNASPADTQAVSVDTAVPAPPQINDVAGDNVIDSGEASSAITVSGTAEVGSSVVVTWDGVIRNTTATDGTWSVNFETVPAEGDYEIRATATDQAGNVSEPRTLMVTVDFSDASGDGGGAFALMSIDFAIPEFELDGMRSLSIDRLVDDSNGAPGNVVASGGLAGDSTPVLTISLSDLMGDGESIRLMRNGVPVASTSDPGASWNLGDDLANAPAGQYSYTAELVSGGNVLATSESYMYNFQVV